MGLSIRDFPLPAAPKRAAIEKSMIKSMGVSTKVRKQWREYWKSHNMPSMLGQNQEINNLIASDAANSQLLHRFLLRSGEVCSIKKSNTFLYLLVHRSGGQEDVIAMQQSYKEPPEEVRKHRLSEEWLKSPHKPKGVI
jgi:hypothetical protein